jgi:1-acyl-sn-glycerol-3-phosphate acyltransferase
MIGSIFRFTAAVALTFVNAIAALVCIPFDRKGKLYHGISRFWSRNLLRVCGVRVRVRGGEHIDRSRPTVYVSNHASMLDIPVVVAGIADDVRLVYKKELEWIPFFGWGLKWGSYIGIDRGRGKRAARSLEDAVEKIRGGTSVLLFAEGTRTSDGKLQPFKRGAFSLAMRAGVSVIPLTINGSYGIVPKHSMRIRPGTVDLVLDAPIHLEKVTGRDAELRLMEQVHAAIEKNYSDQ